MKNRNEFERLTRKRTKDDERAKEELENYYEKRKEVDSPRKKRRAIVPTSEVTAGKEIRERRAKEVLSGKRPSVQGNENVMELVAQAASQSILDNRGEGSSKQVAAPEPESLIEGVHTDTQPTSDINKEKPSSLEDLKTLTDLLQFIPSEYHEAIRDADQRARKAFNTAASKDKKEPRQLVEFVKSRYNVTCTKSKDITSYKFECLGSERLNASFIDIEPEKGIISSSLTFNASSDGVHFSDLQRYVCINDKYEEIPIKEYHSNFISNEDTIKVLKALYYANAKLDPKKVTDKTLKLTRESAAFMSFLGTEINLSKIFLARDLGLAIQSATVQRMGTEIRGFQLRFIPARQSLEGVKRVRHQ